VTQSANRSTWRCRQRLNRLITATARVHGMTVVTRNVKDFELAGVQVLNPFTE
jgi:predicted nucleic acid-binding protein